MAKKKEMYKCEVCGNLVKVMHGGKGALVCCDQPMKLLEPNTVDTSHEKHVPVIEKNGSTCTVKIGSTPHPMEKEHYIELIELMTEDRTYEAFLEPGKKPEASFEVQGNVLGAREHCTVHGLWMKDM